MTRYDDEMSLGEEVNICMRAFLMDEGIDKQCALYLYGLRPFLAERGRTERLKMHTPIYVYERR